MRAPTAPNAEAADAPAPNKNARDGPKRLLCGCAAAFGANGKFGATDDDVWRGGISLLSRGAEIFLIFAYLSSRDILQ